jgi:hypothetical protein
VIHENGRVTLLAGRAINVIRPAPLDHSRIMMGCSVVEDGQSHPNR